MKKLELLKKSVEVEGEKIPLLELVELFSGKKLSIKKVPLLGNILSSDGIISEIENELGPTFGEGVGQLEFGFRWGDGPVGEEKIPGHRELLNIYIGNSYTGPLFSWSEKPDSTKRWEILHSKHNFGKNPASGGNWFGAGPRGFFETLEDAAEIRLSDGEHRMMTTDTGDNQEGFLDTESTYRESSELHRLIRENISELLKKFGE